MRALRCGPFVVSWAVLACGGCFGGFEQPPRAATTGTTKPRAPATTRPAPDSKEEQQSYGEAWRLICEAERRAGVDRELDRAGRGAAVADWIVRQLKNKRVRYWFIGFGRVTRDRRGHFLAEAQRAGQPRCALADLLFQDPASLPAR